MDDREQAIAKSAPDIVQQASWPNNRVLYVSEEVIEQHLNEWGPPVQFKFEKKDNNEVVLWMRNVE